MDSSLTKNGGKFTSCYSFLTFGTTSIGGRMCKTSWNGMPATYLDMLILFNLDFIAPIVQMPLLALPVLVQICQRNANRKLFQKLSALHDKY